jgi:heme oxygenase (mycobilin-producing)
MEKNSTEVKKMNVYITHGTYDYLKKLKDMNENENMLLLQNEDTTYLFHETLGESVFKEPQRYEAVDQSGNLVFDRGFAVINFIPVTEEGRPLFEYRFKNRAGQIENEPGFVAMRVLRPISSDTYAIFTLWEDENAFTNWQNSKSFEKAHAKKKTSDESSSANNKHPQIFPRPSYVKKYNVIKGD